MTETEMEAVYDRLFALQAVDIDHALERGRDYLVERLMDCRRRQDEVGQIAVRVKRALYTAKVARRNAQAVGKLSKAPADRAMWLDAEHAYDAAKALEESVNVCRSTLRAADSDIRLAAGLLGMQITLGNPGSPPASDTAPPVATTPATAKAPTGLDALFGDTTTAPAQQTTRPPSATVHVPDAATFDLDSLLSNG